MGTLERRISALEVARAKGGKSPAEMTDAELMAAILRGTTGREPAAADVAEWLALPDAEFNDRLKELGVLNGND